MIRPVDFIHALSAIAGFAAGGGAVILVVSMMSGPPVQAIALESAELAPATVPVELERRARPALPEPADSRVGTLRATSSTTARGSIDADSLAALIEGLRERDLELPVVGIVGDDLRDDYDDSRSGGRIHEALDILAPRGSPVVAVEDGTIASLDPSQGGGGIVVYQYDPAGEFVYYYAHLEGYTDGLEEGQPVERGDVLGYVGTSGNAPPDVPHLHFAIYKTAVDHRWWKGIPVNPFLVLR